MESFSKNKFEFQASSSVEKEISIFITVGSNELSFLKVGRGGLGERCRPCSRRVPGSKLNFTEDALGLLHPKSSLWDQKLHRRCDTEVWRRGATPGVTLVM
ncbi:hypothetical protein AVEN_270554-1 [Araneus ventricosus]|uniref:Uncharacterized protein n=1 Tax=Araneus ventricosus TaxID=182803 RepID=A0A4Y2B8B7_ARAVE|nr:hypothetical protein AVEN_270554-1 [Araneus ventricosus]